MTLVIFDLLIVDAADRMRERVELKKTPVRLW
jgi:hypothetical protein